MAKKQESENDQILQTAKKRVDLANEYWRGIYSRGREDCSFAYGDQWADEIKKERAKERRPCLTENRLLPFIHQVVNSIRQQRPKIRTIPADNEAAVEVSEILDGVIRNIEKHSDAESAYDTAAKSAVEFGLGYLRVRTDYIDDNSFDQDIKIERILNPESVVIDPMHKNLDGSDAEYAFIYEDVLKEDFKEMYPDEDMAPYEESEVMQDGWASEHTIRIAEYYYKHYEKKTLVKLMDGTVAYKDELDDQQLAYVDLERETQVCSIKWCKLSGCSILEKTDVLGKYIPIIPVVGEEAYVNGKREMFSLIHQARDPQFMLNVWKSASVEIVGLQPKAPYIGAVGSFKSYPSQWAQANIRNFPFLQYDPVTIVDDNGNSVLLPPPQRQPPPTSSGSMMQEAMASSEAIKASLGMYNAAAGEETNDVSGKAIIARQLRSDNATFHFADNLATAMKQVGRVLVDLIPQVYSQSTIISITGEDGVTNKVAINQPYKKEGKEYLPAPEGVKGEGVIRFDLGRYDIDIDIGASYDTKRQEQANAILELSRVNPEILNIAGDLFVKSLDIPLAQEIAKRIQSTMNPALLGDDPMASAMKQMNDTIDQLKLQLDEANSALLAKDNNQAIENQVKLGELEIKRQELQMKAANSMAELNNKKLEVQAEAFKDYAQGISELQSQVDDVREAMSILLEREEAADTPEVSVTMVSGEPESPEEESVL